MTQNPGKLFEQDFQKSAPETCWIYRLRDNASSFANGNNTRFATSNICDYILFDDTSKTLMLIECKSVKGSSVPLTVIRENQVKGLSDANRHSLIAGFLINFRNTNNDTYFISITHFIRMCEHIGKKSFNTKDLVNYKAIKIHNTKKRTRYTYDIPELINKLNIEAENGD